MIAILIALACHATLVALLVLVAPQPFDAFVGWLAYWMFGTWALVRYDCSWPWLRATRLSDTLRRSLCALRLDSVSHARLAALAPDLRGLGRSEGPAEPGEYSLGIWADDARAWLDELGWERAVVAGLSMGGYTAFEFARRYPERLAALILLDTHPRADEPDTIANRRRSQQIVAREGVAGIADGLLERVLGRRTRQLQPGIVADVRRMMHAAPVAGVVGALEAMARRSEATSLLSGITVPVLVAAGEDDLLTPPARTQEWAHRLPDAVIATIPEAGHVTSLEAPGAVNAIIRHFVEGLEPIG